MGILQDYTVEQLAQLIAECDEAIERYEREVAGRRHVIHDLQRERAQYIVELGNRP